MHVTFVSAIGDRFLPPKNANFTIVAPHSSNVRSKVCWVRDRTLKTRVRVITSVDPIKQVFTVLLRVCDDYYATLCNNERT